MPLLKSLLVAVLALQASLCQRSEQVQPDLKENHPIQYWDSINQCVRGMYYSSQLSPIYTAILDGLGVSSLDRACMLGQLLAQYEKASTESEIVKSH